MPLIASQASGHVTCHVADGASFLRACPAETYDLLVLDLDLGAVLGAELQGSGGLGAGARDGAGLQQAAGQRLAALADLRRVLRPRGVLLVNEYCDGDGEPRRIDRDAAALLAAGFPEVHAFQATGRNHLLLAPKAGSTDPDGLVALAAARSRRVRIGVDAAALLSAISAKQHRVFR